MNPEEGSSLYNVDFPALLPEELPTSIETRMETRMSSAFREIDMLKKQAGEQAKVTNTHTKLLFNFMERDVMVAAGEILKWSVKKRGEKDGDGRHLFDSDPVIKSMVTRGCLAIGMPCDRNGLIAYKDLSRTVIRARNDTAHFVDLQTLERVVHNCIQAIETWPELAEKPELKDQVLVITHYNDYKRILPECFQC